MLTTGGCAPRGSLQEHMQRAVTAMSWSPHVNMEEKPRSTHTVRHRILLVRHKQTMLLNGAASLSIQCMCYCTAAVLLLVHVLLGFHPRTPAAHTT
jgi:hypothetical protein